MVEKMKIGLIGGTGNEGKGLAVRLGKNKFEIYIGSRNQKKAHLTSEILKKEYPKGIFKYGSNEEIARICDILILTVPFANHKEILQKLESFLINKIIIDTVCPITVKKGKVQLLSTEYNSVAESAQNYCPKSKIVGAFHNISALELLSSNRNLKGDVIVCSDHNQAKETVSQLIHSIKALRPIDGGPLKNSRYPEQFTGMLISLNIKYKVNTSLLFEEIP